MLAEVRLCYQRVLVSFKLVARLALAVMVDVKDDLAKESSGNFTAS